MIIEFNLEVAALNNPQEGDILMAWARKQAPLDTLHRRRVRLEISAQRCSDNHPELDCRCGGQRGRNDCMFPDGIVARVYLAEPRCLQGCQGHWDNDCECGSLAERRLT
jgi:hypothetical protein